MTTLLALPERTWWVFDDNKGPCGCCSAMTGFSGGDGLWECANGPRWHIVDEPPTVDTPHSAELCPGDCPQHPLLTPYLLAFIKAVWHGASWGGVVQAEEDAALAALSAEERRAKEAQQANARAAAELLASLAAEASKMANYADQKGIAARCKHAKGKVQEPCVWLYCDEAAPKSQWYRNKKGELCAPKRNGLTGSQCWAWEYVDPKTKQHKKPHTCDHLHPGEPGWLKEWNKDRTFRPSAAGAAGPPPSRWDGLAGRGSGGGYVAPKPAAAAKPKAGGGFAALSGWDSD
jgi:hypothetical protein